MDGASSSATTSSTKPAKNLSVPEVCFEPPWSKQEPPSPDEGLPVDTWPAGAPQSRPSSHHSTYFSAESSRWWTFNTQSRKFPSAKDKSLSWLPTPNPTRDQPSLRRLSTKRPEREPKSFRDWNLSITLPAPNEQPLTLSHANTPGWNTPWTSRPAAQGPFRRYNDEEASNADWANVSDQSSVYSSIWKKRRKRFRSFVLTNTYVPLVGSLHQQLILSLD
jgi:hypothetical protein